jgi:Tfp pilus assembly protein PilX
MQRKNNILNSAKTSKNGIAMIMAISVLVIIATILALSLALSSQTTKRTTDLYLYEQSVLLSKSATEYAILRITQDGPCTHSNDLNFVQDEIYDINITARFIYDSNASCVASGGLLYTTVTTPEQNGSVLIDVSVSVNNSNVSTEPIRYFKRTLQKL